VLICYADEAGNTGLYHPADPASSPVFALVGISVDETRADDVLMEYLRLKQRFVPVLRTRQLSQVIQHEVKGAALRRDIRKMGSLHTTRRALSYLNQLISLLERHHVKLMGRVLVKRAGEVYSSASTYPSAVADIAGTLDRQARDAGARSLLVLDAQTKVKNEGNVHQITTRRFRHGGNMFPTFVESPVFGHSDTHSLLQVADLVASGLVYPMACAAYLPPVPGDAHRDPAYQAVRATFGKRLAGLEYRYPGGNGNLRGGFRVIDRVGEQGAGLLFGNP